MDTLHTCMFCGQEIHTAVIYYTFFIPMGDDEPLCGTGKAHVACIREFEREQFDYDQMAVELIAAWERKLTQLNMN